MGAPIPAPLLLALTQYHFGWPGNLLALIVLVVEVVAIVSVLTGRRSVLSKVLWILAILLFPFLGVLLYLLLGRHPTHA